MTARRERGGSGRAADNCWRRREPLYCGLSCSIIGITTEDSCSSTCAFLMCPSRRCTARLPTRIRSLTPEGHGSHHFGDQRKVTGTDLNEAESEGCTPVRLAGDER